MYNPNLMKAIVTISYRFYSDFLELHQQLICSTLFPTISNTSCIFYQAIDADHKTVFKNSLSSLCENNKSIFLLCHNLGSENNYSFFLNFPLMPADQAMRTNGVKKLQTEEEVAPTHLIRPLAHLSLSFPSKTHIIIRSSWVLPIFI